MKRFILGAAALFAAWMWSRGARDPREWPRRVPEEITALWDDLDEAFGSARRAAARREREFDEELRRFRAGD